MASTSKKRMQRRRAASQRKNKNIALAIGVAVIGLGAFFFFQNTAAPSQTANFNPGEVAPEIGALAPNFTLSDTDGNTVSLSDFRGKPVAVMLFHSW